MVQYLRMEEDLRTKEALVAYIDSKRLFGDSIDSIITLHPLGRVRVVFGKFFSNVRTNVTVSLFDRLGSFQRLLWGNSHLAFTQQRLDEVSDVAA